MGCFDTECATIQATNVCSREVKFQNSVFFLPLKIQLSSYICSLRLDKASHSTQSVLITYSVAYSVSMFI